MELITSLAIGGLAGLGVYQILRRNTIRSLIGVMILANAVNLLLLAIGAYNSEEPAYTTAAGTISDPFPQALILTAIVISMGGTAFTLGLLYVISSRYRTSDLDEVSNLKN